ncbi:alpha/beta hydrolase [Labrys wisconsinensis]|uniref:Esterase/lipase superfamily enzyme n=1 Tax=Labrys wisconsinensis TaxID=425677 RepID=A0ABU0JGM8_9HYPH|nr:alpha/beta hydrolase [Labrys wisconsinensis]MDQ0473434.1 esterase/lipase superfamily enzyme [Labrys wisconsinensis]
MTGTDETAAARRAGGPRLLSLVLSLCLCLAACATRPENVLQPVPAPVAGASRVDMLVMTTRKPAADPGELFSGERGTAVSLSNIVVSIPPDRNRKVGEIQWPARVPGDPATEFVTLGTRTVASEPQIFDWFRRNRGPKRRALIFVHGFNNTYADAVYRLAQVSHDSGIDAAPVLFAWPSRGSTFDYLYDKESANFSRYALEDLLRHAAASPDVGEVTILAHSMGSWLTAEALREMAIRDKGISPKIRNVVLASPDIDVDVFRRQIIEMGPRRPQFTIIASRGDRALALSRWISGDVDRLGAADLRPYAADLKGLGISIIDTTDVQGTDALAHNTFADSPEMVRLLGRRLAGQSLETGEIGLADRVGGVALGSARVLGSAAGAALAAPVAVLDPAARSRFRRQIDEAEAPAPRVVNGQVPY